MIPNLLKLNRYKKFIVKSIFIATKLSKTLENTQNHSINIFPHSYGITFNMENSNNQLLICKQMSKITFNIPQLVKDATYTSGKEVLIFFFSPVNKNPKCIRNASEILAMAPTSENLNSIRNASEIFIPPLPDQFLNIFCVLHTHPQLQHLILNFHISASPTHPKIINNF